MIEFRHSWLETERPRRYLDVIGAHLPLALISIILIGAAALVPLEWLTLRPCSFLSITSLPCLFCGSSRAFRHMAQGEWSEAFTMSPLAALLFILVALVLLWNLCGLVTGYCIRPGPRLRFWEGRGKTVLLIAVLLVLMNWLYRVAMNLDKAA